MDDIFRLAIELWESGRYRDAEQVLLAALERRRGSLTVREEAELRIKLAYTLKSQEQFTRAFAELEYVLALPVLPADLETTVLR